MQIYSETLDHGRFENWSSKPDLQLIHAHQVHGTEIASPETLPCEADGMIVSWENFHHPLAIKTADCMPIVIEGEKGAIFLHAGWKSLADGILKRAEVAMINPKSAFIGPSIRECCFEVTEEFKNHFPQSTHFSHKGSRLTFNLQAEALDQLRTLFPNLKTQDSGICTMCSEKFHSYRRDKTKERNWNLYLKG